MKNIIKIILCISILSIFNVGFASYTGDIADSIRIVGSTPGTGNAGVGNAGKVVFPDTANGVHVDTTGLISAPTGETTFQQVDGDIGISGDFWLYNTSAPAGGDTALGWATFDIGTVTGATPVVLNYIGSNKFRFNGYAWSNAAGWIFFGNTGVTGGEVIYNRTTSKIEGHAWSQNLGWIQFDFDLDTTPTNINNILNPTAANHIKNFTLDEQGKITIDKPFALGINIYASAINHIVDIRESKKYNITVTDTSGNTAAGVLTVVANVPSDVGYSGATPSTFTDTSGGPEIADGDKIHNIDFTLRDTYGNIVKNEGGIKTVNVILSMSNNVDLNQITNPDNGGAIEYSLSDFSGINNTNNQGNASRDDGNYQISFSSYAPTSSGYSFTTPDNNIKINNLEIDIINSTGIDFVGEGSYDIGNIFGSAAGSNSFWDNIGNNYQFTPMVEIGSVTSSGLILRDYENQFTTNLKIYNDTSNDVTNLITDNIFDIFSSGSHINLNIFMSMQSYTGITSPYTNHCEGYNQSDGSGSLNYIITPPSETLCNKSSTGSSNLAINIGTITGDLNENINFKATPRVVMANINNSNIDYSSEVYYTFDSNNISYPSLKDDGIENVNNDEVMITGIVNDSNNYYTVKTGSTINYIGEISKAEVYKNIHKNVAAYQRLGSSKDYDGIKYINNADITIDPTWFTSGNFHTIIADGHNIKITSDIGKSSNDILSIIAVQDEDGNGGNIFINKDVQKIHAILVADKSIISGDGTNFYSDNRTANKQLYIKGSIISNNTIGRASELTPKCPFYITGTCNLEKAKRYDLNHFRSFIFESGSGSLNWTGINKLAGYDESPLIIEYDSRMKQNIPVIFRK